DNQRKMERNPNYKADAAKNSRKDTKLTNRIKALKKLNVDKEAKKAISAILIRPIMSSDEEEIDGQTKTFIVRKPRWRTDGITSCFKTLDGTYQNNQSKHSLFRLMKRIDGPPSEREEPEWSERMRTAIQFFD
uniref:Uncharacterized protein n=2 Tax=Clytia hemisphaerica TaxID=252671 RepID=A0A7M5UHC2_9CNID